jgi:hypothetical protein
MADTYAPFSPRSKNATLILCMVLSAAGFFPNIGPGGIFYLTTILYGGLVHYFGPDHKLSKEFAEKHKLAEDNNKAFEEKLASLTDDERDAVLKSTSIRPEVEVKCEQCDIPMTGANVSCGYNTITTDMHILCSACIGTSANMTNISPERLAKVFSSSCGVIHNGKQNVVVSASQLEKHLFPKLKGHNIATMVTNDNQYNLYGNLTLKLMFNCLRLIFVNFYLCGVELEHMPPVSAIEGYLKNTTDKCQMMNCPEYHPSFGSSFDPNDPNSKAATMCNSGHVKSMCLKCVRRASVVNDTCIGCFKNVCTFFYIGDDNRFYEFDLESDGRVTNYRRFSYFHAAGIVENCPSVCCGPDDIIAPVPGMHSLLECFSGLPEPIHLVVPGPVPPGPVLDKAAD